MNLLLVAALTLGLATIALSGLLAIGRGLFQESIIDAPLMPDARARESGRADRRPRMPRRCRRIDD
jgi:hypothetical protein